MTQHVTWQDRELIAWRENEKSQDGQREREAEIGVSRSIQI
jgi:hypothetical protein